MRSISQFSTEKLRLLQDIIYTGIYRGTRKATVLLGARGKKRTRFRVKAYPFPRA